MATPPSKRRKTSPMTAVSANTPRTPPRQTSPTRGGARTTPNRASFLSPTKASLSRSHPDLLPRAQSEGRRRPSSKGGEGLVNGGTAARDIAGREENSIAPPGLDTPSVRRSPRGTKDGGIGAPPRRRSRTPGGRGSSPVKIATEAAPASENILETNGDTQTQVENARNSRVNGTVENPDLPPFPQADPVASRPLAGLEYSPSRKPRRNKGLAERLKSSPLKAKDGQKEAPTVEDRSDDRPKDINEREHQEQREEPQAASRIESASTVQEDSVILQKRATRDELLRQVHGRRRQIDQLEKEILRQQADSVSANPHRGDKKSADRLM
jgi:hypothetical protein